MSAVSAVPAAKPYKTQQSLGEAETDQTHDPTMPSWTVGEQTPLTVPEERDDAQSSSSHIKEASSKNLLASQLPAFSETLSSCSVAMATDDDADEAALYQVI